ncbi:MAG: DUF2125 domain-containing protein, partial [Paracoccaceae bacterium]|nr:DUF2125 domain-containing protein [Paracoccaceae bacterium]
VGARGLEKAARAWFAGQAAQGYLAQNAGLAVQGFPNRFDLTITAPRLSDPARGIGWQAPFVQILSLSYKPWHIIAALPPTQTLTLPGSALTLTSDKLQASLIVEPTPALTLDRLAIAGSRLTLRADAGWQISAQSARLATRQAQLLRNTHEIGIEINGLTPDPALTSALVPPADMPETIDQIALSLLLAFSGPIDRFTPQSRPVLMSLEVKEATLDILGRFTEELFALQRAIRLGDGAHLHDYFTRTRAIRRGIIEAGQDTAAPDFGRGAGAVGPSETKS